MMSSLVLILGLLSFAHAEEEDGNDLEWMGQFSGMFPFLCASFFIIFSLNLLLFPQFATFHLLRQYLNEGIHIDGTVLSCETKAGSGGDAFIVEVAYEASEHKFANNASLKFRNPGAFEKKQFVRRFEFDREMPRGQVVDILLPSGPNGTRSGCPREVVEKLLDGYSRMRTLLILVPGLILLAVCIGMAIWEVLRIDDPAKGWVVLFGFLGLSELMAFLFCADQFFKSKRRRFDSARPMITSEERAAAVEANRPTREQLLDPYSVPFHEFAGHARATERAVR
jgi:hypothetical protein